MTREQEDALCKKLMEKAADFAKNPKKGRDAGYQPRQRFQTDPGPHIGLDRPSAVPIPIGLYEWLHAVAKKDLDSKGIRWRVEEGPEEPFLIIL
jgi:hypothetical protein